MQSLSPEAAVRQWELWLYNPAGLREPLESCGLFGSRGEAHRVGSAVRLWLHVRVWTPEVLDKLLPPGADPDSPDGAKRLDLLTLPDHLARLGFDPARTLVTVPRFGEEHDNAAGAADDGSEDDTLLAPPDVTYLVADGDEAA